MKWLPSLFSKSSSSWQICRLDVQDGGVGVGVFWPEEANCRDRGQTNRQSVQKATTDDESSPSMRLGLEMGMWMVTSAKAAST